MSSDTPTTFPDFTWDEYFWVTTATLPGCGECTGGRGYGGRPESAIVDICFAPEKRGEGPIHPKELSLVQWVIDLEKSICDAMLQGLFDHYPVIREEVLDCIDEEDAAECLPAIESPEAFMPYIGMHSINIHQIDDGKGPYFGIEVWCPWDEDHTQGILMHGTLVLEVGYTDMACYLHLAERYADEQNT